jgi:drug/metabolite transporter (DMT)-like permease
MTTHAIEANVGAQVKGNVFLLVNALCLAVGSVVLHGYLVGMDPIVFAFYCFVAVVAITLILRLVVHRSIADVWAAVIANRKHLLLLNIATAANWILYFISIKISDGALANALLFGAAPIAALFLSGQQNKQKIGYSVAILVLLAVLAATYVGGTVENIYVAIAAGVLSGIGVGATTISMKALGTAGVKVLDVVLLRYLMTIGATAAILLGLGTPVGISAAQGANTFWIAALMVVVPTMLVQMGIRLTSAFNTAVMSSSIPMLTCIASIFFGARFSIVQIVVFVVLSLVLLRMSTVKNL